MRWLTILLLFAMGCTPKAENTTTFATIFTNNAVLQQDTVVSLWGFSRPKEPISFGCSWLEKPIQSVADPQGRWIVEVNTPKASFTPHTLTLCDSRGNTEILSNILIGEVWLCSGQSNMEMVLKSFPEWNLVVEHSQEVIAKANYPHIRMVTTDRKESFTPQDEVKTKGGWIVCTPASAEWFSAVAFFFGRELFETLNVPIGLIVTPYGGSPIQSWLPLNVMEGNPLYANVLNSRSAELKASTQSEKEYGEAMKGWIKESEATSPNSKLSTESIILPINFEQSTMGNQMGEILLKRNIHIDNSPSSDLLVSLGTMDDLGRVYFNGELVWEELRNSHSYSQVNFTIPASKVRKGDNSIEVRILNILWGGGLTGPANAMYYSFKNDSSQQPLTGEWQFQKIFDLHQVKPIPREGKPQFSTASALYNGMLHPLAGFSIKGFVWYQGEENVDLGHDYAYMQKVLITAWRKLFGNERPFYYVQIAPFAYKDHLPNRSVELREAQALVETQVPKTAMIVTQDVGDANNIHPAKKQEVGNRIARIALAKTYGIDCPSQFPKPLRAYAMNNSLVLTFANTYKGLVVKGDQHEFELSEDGKTYYPASARKINSAEMMVTSKTLKHPRHVRYCWGDGSHGTIFNSEGLPLALFRMSATPPQ
ncbi:MAG: sialate O-acetylesterase [Bacteroidales bacterium]